MNTSEVQLVLFIRQIRELPSRGQNRNSRLINCEFPRCTFTGLAGFKKEQETRSLEQDTSESNHVERERERERPPTEPNGTQL